MGLLEKVKGLIQVDSELETHILPLLDKTKLNLQEGLHKTELAQLNLIKLTSHQASL